MIKQKSDTWNEHGGGRCAVWLNQTFIKRIWAQVHLPGICSPFPIYFIAVPEIAEAINTRGSLKGAPKRRKDFFTQFLNCNFFLLLVFWQEDYLILWSHRNNFSTFPLFPLIWSCSVRCSTPWKNKCWGFKDACRLCLNLWKLFPLQSVISAQIQISAVETF